MTTDEAKKVQEELEQGLIEGLEEVKKAFLNIFGFDDIIFYKLLASAVIRKIRTLEGELNDTK